MVKRVNSNLVLSAFTRTPSQHFVKHPVGQCTQSLGHPTHLPWDYTVSCALRDGIKRSVGECLTSMGTDPAKVQDVIVTHLHYDHAGTLTDFPRAQFHLQVAEPAYATGPCMCDPRARAVA